MWHHSTARKHSSTAPKHRRTLAPAPTEFLSCYRKLNGFKHDTITKRKLYEQNKVREYWIVDPKAGTIAQFVLRGRHYELTELAESEQIKSDVLTGFEMNVGELIKQ